MKGASDVGKGGGAKGMWRGEGDVKGFVGGLCCITCASTVLK